MKIPEKDADHRGGDPAQPHRPDDDAPGRGQHDPRAVRRGDRLHQRRGHRRRWRRVHHRVVGTGRGGQRKGGRPMSGRVLVVGSVNVDLVVQTDRLPLPGETVLGGTFKRFHGGKGGNQAVAAARLGVPVMLVAALGRRRVRRRGAGRAGARGHRHGRAGHARPHDHRRGADPGRREGREPDRGRPRRERRPHRGARAPGAGPAAPPRRRRGHRDPRDPHRRRARGAAHRPAGRRLDDPQPGPGGRPGPVADLARRRRRPQPGRARPARRRRRPPLRPADQRRRGAGQGRPDPARDDQRGTRGRPGDPRLAGVGGRDPRAARGPGRSTSRRPRSRRSTRRARATRSTARWPRRSPAGWTSRPRRAGPWSRRACP